MIYEVQNRKTKAIYPVDQKVFDKLDMKRKFKLLDSWDETAKQRVLIPSDIVIKSTESVKAKVEKPKANTKNEINE